MKGIFDIELFVMSQHFFVLCRETDDVRLACKVLGGKDLGGMVFMVTQVFDFLLVVKYRPADET